MSFSNSKFNNSECPFYGKTFISKRQLVVDLSTESHQPVIEICEILLPISIKNIQYINKEEAKSLTFNWKFENKEGDNWHYIDQYHNEWILNDLLITWIVPITQTSITFFNK